MSAEEMSRAEKLAEIARNIPEKNADYLIGVADGMMRALASREEEKTNAES